MKLTKKQKMFADEYLRNGFNATQAAIKAGYSKKAARAIGSENLTKQDIKDYLAKKTGKVSEKLEFDVEQAIKSLVSIAQGAPFEHHSKQIDHLKRGKVVKDMTYEYSADYDQRLKALEMYLKINGQFDKQDNTPNVVVNITNDVVEFDSDG